jgi:hypothetical protein
MSTVSGEEHALFSSRCFLVGYLAGGGVLHLTFLASANAWYRRQGQTGSGVDLNTLEVYIDHGYSFF